MLKLLKTSRLYYDCSIQQSMSTRTIYHNLSPPSRWPPSQCLLQSSSKKQRLASRAYHASYSHPCRTAQDPLRYPLPVASLFDPLFRPTLIYPKSRYQRKFFSSGRSLPDTGALLTKAIIGICTLSFAVHFYSKFLRDKRNDPILFTKYEENFVCSSHNYRQGRWWVLLTSSVAHNSLPHLGINMYVLYSLAPITMTLYGIPTFVALWGITSVTCGGAYIYWEEINSRSVIKRWDSAGAAEKNPPSFLGITPNAATRAIVDGQNGAVGASGVLSGMMTVLACRIPSASTQIMFIPISIPIWVTMAAAGGFSWLALANGAVAGLGHAGHLGGMMGGLGFWLLRTVVGRGR